MGRNKKSLQEGVPEGYKRCSKCGEVKEVGDFYTYGATCRQCMRKKVREYSEKNIDKIKEYQKRNAGKKKEYMSKYRIQNREVIKIKTHEYRTKKAKPKECLPDGMRRCKLCGEIKEINSFVKNKNWCSTCRSKWASSYYQNNKTRISEYCTKWSLENTEHLKEYRRMKYSNNKDIISEKAKKYRSIPTVSARSSALAYFYRRGMNSKTAGDLVDLKTTHILLTRAIKGHKEVTNG